MPLFISLLVKENVEIPLILKGAKRRGRSQKENSLIWMRRRSRSRGTRASPPPLLLWETLNEN